MLNYIDTKISYLYILSNILYTYFAPKYKKLNYSMLNTCFILNKLKPFTIKLLTANFASLGKNLFATWHNIRF